MVDTRLHPAAPVVVVVKNFAMDNVNGMILPMYVYHTEVMMAKIDILILIIYIQ